MSKKWGGMWWLKDITLLKSDVVIKGYYITKIKWISFYTMLLGTCKKGLAGKTGWLCTQASNKQNFTITATSILWWPAFF